jgi:hypothetical protein
MKLEEACRQGFGLHQTFPPRFGWLKKAFDEAQKNPTIFSKQDATVQLGVGKNMVDAIAFWAVAFRILETSQDSKKSASIYKLTAFGSLLFDEKNEKMGLDPYLESPQSLWLLHWMAMRPVSRLPVWWLTFAMFSQTEFNTEDLYSFVFEETEERWDYSKEKPIQKDLDCMMRMYSPRVAKAKASLDDYLDSPFRDLGLIVPSSISSKDRNSYRFQIGEKPGLAPLMVLLACLDYMNLQGAVSLTAPRLSSDIGSPGRVFRLNEAALNAALSIATAKINGVRLETPAGVPQLVMKKPVYEVMAEVIEAMYPGKKIQVDIADVFPQKVVSNTPFLQSEKKSTSPKMTQKSDDTAASTKKAGSVKKSLVKATVKKADVKKNASKKNVVKKTTKSRGK